MAVKQRIVFRAGWEDQVAGLVATADHKLHQDKGQEAVCQEIQHARAELMRLTPLWELQVIAI